MTLAKEVLGTLLFFSDEIVVQKDMLVVADINTFIVFDLKSSLEPKGIINRVNDMHKSSIMMVLQHRGVIYHSRTLSYENWVIRAIYNLTHPPITSKININSQQSLCYSLTQTPSPSIPLLMIDQPTCGLYFYFEHKRGQDPFLVRYSECSQIK
jgi:hypothetical protein